MPYFQALVALTLATDAAGALTLTRAGTRPGRTLLGATLWVGGLPLLLPILPARYDVQGTALAVLALMASARSTRACGTLAALGALVKLWPILLLTGLPRGPGEQVGVDRGRGDGHDGTGVPLHPSTMPGTARRPGKVRYQYGALEYTGPHVPTVAHISLALTVVALGLLPLQRLAARRRAPAPP
ncbi:hypothetical protein ACI2L1_21655 [Streptomyces sp. NPDC019531]|uniref:hypothetical protein n=1 Tax=Streptomyces sp. NPDC019531 TaxID=3365062 RepID=UPI00384F291D